ncbi:MAG: hypothetical protein ACE5I1_19540 [bacterium]
MMQSKQRIEEKTKARKVFCKIGFMDAFTGKTFKVGDPAPDWEPERVKEYLERGVLEYRDAIETMEQT